MLSPNALRATRNSAPHSLHCRFTLIPTRRHSSEQNFPIRRVLARYEANRFPQHSQILKRVLDRLTTVDRACRFLAAQEKQRSLALSFRTNSITPQSTQVLSRFQAFLLRRDGFVIGWFSDG